MAIFSCLVVEREHFVPTNLILAAVVLFFLPSAAKAEFPLEQYRSLLALDVGIVQSVLAQELRLSSPGATYGDDTPIELILAKAFIRRFPCDR